jgi:glycosyltransferase involved in cell wall biosynthesis
MIREIHPLRDWRAYVQLKGLIAQLKPDIVHTHSSKAGIIGRAAAWSVLRGNPQRAPGVVHTIHGPPFMPGEGSLPRRLKTRAVNKMYEVAERFAARRCHSIVGVADDMTRQFLARRIGRPEQYSTVYSGMETERFLTPDPGESRDEVRARLGLGAGRFVIGTVARLAEHKGHDDLLDGLGDDLKRNPHWALLWVGDGWWRERLLAKARGLNISVLELDRVPPPAASEPVRGSDHQLLLTGLVTPDRVPGLMRAMDVLAHPSSREGLPRTVPQALLCGTAPIAYDVDGTREVCMDGVTGRLVRLGDRAALAGAIRALADDPGERAALAERGRTLCADRFSIERMIADLEGVYTQARAAAVAGGGAGVR